MERNKGTAGCWGWIRRGARDAEMELKSIMILEIDDERKCTGCCAADSTIDGVQSVSECARCILEATVRAQFSCTFLTVQVRSLPQQSHPLSPKLLL
jgi:hypothetical protein